MQVFLVGEILVRCDIRVVPLVALGKKLVALPVGESERDPEEEDDSDLMGISGQYHWSLSRCKSED